MIAHADVSESAAPRRPVVALVHLVPTPYWFHLHRRLIAEIPEIVLRIAYTHDVPDQAWSLNLAEDGGAITFGDGSSLETASVWRIAMKEWAKAARVQRWLRESCAAAVVLGGYNDFGRLRLIAHCHRRRLPLFLHGDSNIHGDRATGLKGFIKRALVGWVMRRCAGVMPFGTAGRQFFQKYGARSDRVFYLPGEPDYAQIQNITTDQISAASRQFSFTPGRKRILFCGRLIPLKRVADLIDAFACIVPDRPDWELVVIGDGPLKPDLTRRAADAGIADRIRWCGFISDTALTAAIYRACDVLVLPSDRDAWALVVNEALAAGMTVVVSTVVGSSDDLVKDRVSGRLFPPGDVPALTEALLDVTDSAKLAEYKAQSTAILRDWRTRGDPVQGLRNALRAVAVLK